MNFKKSNEKPTTDAVAEAEVLAQFDRLRAVLIATHAAIPQLLARERTISRALGLNETEELRAQLSDTVAERGAAVRRRSAALAAIAELEPALQAERASLETQRQEYAVEAVQAFQARYSAAVCALQACWEEGRALAATLRTEVPMPLPVRVTTSVVDGVARAMPVRSDVGATVDDPTAARLGAMLDKVDEALALCNAIRQAHEQDARHRALARERRTSADLSSTFVVVKPVTHLGAFFERGTLIDQSVIPVSSLHRFLVGHYIVEATDRPAAAVA